MALVAVTGAITIHTGSTLQGPVPGVASAIQSFVRVEGKPILTLGSVMVTPSHIYAYVDGVPLFHSHTQPVATALQSLLKIEGVPVSIVGDNSIGNLTIISVPNQSFVTVS